jgi:hypothetical protein
MTVIDFAVFFLAVTLNQCGAETDDQDHHNQQEVDAISATKEMCDLSAYDPVWESHFAQRNVITKVKPVYSSDAIKKYAGAYVAVTIVVDRDGNVVMACATTGPPELRQAAEEAALQWKFKKNFGRAPGGSRRYTYDGIVFSIELE